MASLRVRQRKDGSSYTAVLYSLDGKQTSLSFNDHAEAVDFQKLANRVGPAKALEVWRTRQSTDDGHTVASWCAYHIDHLTGANQATRTKYRRYVRNGGVRCAGGAGGPCHPRLSYGAGHPRGDPPCRPATASTVTRTRRHHRGTFLGDAWRRPVFGAWSGEVGRKRPCHGEPVAIDLRFQLHQATHLEADHLGLLVAYDQQRGKPAEERHVAHERKRLVPGPCSKPLRDWYHRVIRRKTRSSLDARLHADLPHKQLRSLLCAQLSAVQAAADPNASSPRSLSDTLHRRSTGIREGSLGILCFGRRLTVLHQVQVHVGHLRWFHHHPADA